LNTDANIAMFPHGFPQASQPLIAREFIFWNRASRVGFIAAAMIIFA